MHRIKDIVLARYVSEIKEDKMAYKYLENDFIKEIETNKLFIIKAWGRHVTESNPHIIIQECLEDGKATINAPFKLNVSEIRFKSDSSKKVIDIKF